MTIEEFIEARLAEDEAAARKAADFPYDDPSDAPWIAMQLKTQRGIAMTSDAHFARHEPARALRDCAAWRGVLRFVSILDGAHERDEADELVLRPLAAIWSDHPDYRQEWSE